MFYNDFYGEGVDYRVNPTLSYVRFLHASPDAPRVDIYANGNIIARNLSYKAFTQYMPLPQGNYNITVFRAGTTNNAVINTRFNLPAGKILTVAAINRLRDIELYAVEDTRLDMNPSKAFVRFVHLSPNTPNVDITLPNGTRVFRNVGYKGVSGYIQVDPGVYTLEARPTGTEQVVLYVPNIRLMPNRAYSIYAVGLLQGNPPLQVLIPLDGSSYIKF